MHTCIFIGQRAIFMPVIEFCNRDYIPVLVLPGSGRRITLLFTSWCCYSQSKANRTEIPPRSLNYLFILFNSFLIPEVVNRIARGGAGTACFAFIASLLEIPGLLQLLPILLFGLIASLGERYLLPNEREIRER